MLCVAAPAKEKPVISQPTQLHQASWEVVRVPDGEAAFSMPSKPLQVARTTRGTAGSLDLLSYSCKFEECDFLLKRTKATVSIAPESVIAQLDYLKKRYVLENARLVSESSIVVDGVIGNDITYTVPTMNGSEMLTKRTRHFVTDQCYYVLTAASQPGKALPPEAGRFLSSLTFEGIVKAQNRRSRKGPEVKRTVGSSSVGRRAIPPLAGSSNQARQRQASKPGN